MRHAGTGRLPGVQLNILAGLIPPLQTGGINTTELISIAGTRSVAAAGTDDIYYDLPITDMKKYHHLTSLTVFADIGGPYTGFGGTVNATGPYIFGVEAWLIRGGSKILLDKGWAVYDKKYTRSVVGFVGRIHYAPKDQIFIAIKNAGEITGTWSATATYDVSDAPMLEQHAIDRQHDDVTFVYQARRVNTQTNAGGGALTTRVSMNVGQVGTLVKCKVTGTASGTSVLQSYILDEDGAVSADVAYIVAGVSRSFSLPNGGTSSSSSANLINTVDHKLLSGEFLQSSSSVALVNETHTVSIGLMLTTPELPVWDTTGSAGTPSLAASTISVANTLTPIVRPRMIA